MGGYLTSLLSLGSHLSLHKMNACSNKRSKKSTTEWVLDGVWDPIDV